MPKVLKVGMEPPTGPPPAGIKFTCDRCGAQLETVEDEQVYNPSSQETAPGLPWKMGWRIPCPTCAYFIFVERPEA